jgi:MinD-like ATPase involved in chromosome partitioning or flagellar assembly
MERSEATNAPGASRTPAVAKPPLQLDHGTGEHVSMTDTVRSFSAPEGAPAPRWPDGPARTPHPARDPELRDRPADTDAAAASANATTPDRDRDPARDTDGRSGVAARVGGPEAAPAGHGRPGDDTRTGGPDDMASPTARTGTADRGDTTAPAAETGRTDSAESDRSETVRAADDGRIGDVGADRAIGADEDTSTRRPESGAIASADSDSGHLGARDGRSGAVRAADDGRTGDARADREIGSDENVSTGRSESGPTAASDARAGYPDTPNTSDARSSTDLTAPAAAGGDTPGTGGGAAGDGGLASAVDAEGGDALRGAEPTAQTAPTSGAGEAGRSEAAANDVGRHDESTPEAVPTGRSASESTESSRRGAAALRDDRSESGTPSVGDTEAPPGTGRAHAAARADDRPMDAVDVPGAASSGGAERSGRPAPDADVRPEQGSVVQAEPGSGVGGRPQTTAPTEAAPPAEEVHSGRDGDTDRPDRNAPPASEATAVSPHADTVPTPAHGRASGDVRDSGPAASYGTAEDTLPDRTAAARRRTAAGTDPSATGGPATARPAQDAGRPDGLGRVPTAEGADASGPERETRTSVSGADAPGTAARRSTGAESATGDRADAPADTAAPRPAREVRSAGGPGASTAADPAAGGADAPRTERGGDVSRTERGGDAPRDERLDVLDRHLSRTDTPAPPPPRFAQADGETRRQPAGWFTDAAPQEPARRRAALRCGAADPRAPGHGDARIAPDPAADRPAPTRGDHAGHAPSAPSAAARGDRPAGSAAGGRAPDRAAPGGSDVASRSADGDHGATAHRAAGQDDRPAASNGAGAAPRSAGGGHGAAAHPVSAQGDGRASEQDDRPTAAPDGSDAVSRPSAASGEGRPVGGTDTTPPLVIPRKPPLELDHGTGEHESFGDVDAPRRRTTAADLEAAEAAAIRARLNRSAPRRAPERPAERPGRADTPPAHPAEDRQAAAHQAPAHPAQDRPTRDRSAAGHQPPARPTTPPTGRTADPRPAAPDAADQERSSRLSRTMRANPTGAQPSAVPDRADRPAGARPPHGDRPADDGVFTRVAQNARRISHLFGQTPPGTAPGGPERRAASGPAAPTEPDKPSLQLDHGTGEQQSLTDTPGTVPPVHHEPPAHTQDTPGSGGTRGWRRLARVVTGGSSAPPKSDLPPADLERLRTPLGGPKNVVVLGCTGGAGQTITTLMLGHTLAAHRDERVVAVDVNPGTAGLSRRVRTETPETLTSLLANVDAVHGYLAMRRYTSQAPTGLEVVATLDDPYVQTLDDRDYAGLAGLLRAYYEVAVLDPAATGVARALPVVDGLVLVAPASEDAARSVAMTFEWLDGHGYAALRSRAVVVINGVSKRSLADVDEAERVARGRCRAIVRVPWDDHLSAGKVVDVGALRATTRRAHAALGGVLLHGLAGGTGAGPTTPGTGNRVGPEVRR